MNKKKLAQDVENVIWNTIKDYSDPDSFEWKIKFKINGKEMILDNDILN